MDINEFAKTLDGREYMNEITEEEEELALELGYVVVFGYSDDCTELRGAIYEETGSCGNHEIFFDKYGLLKNKCSEFDCPYFEKEKLNAKCIEAIWNSEGYSWIYKTDIPHAAFDILEDGEKYCRGIVFDIKELRK
jgi:hypothetical protein